MQASEIVSNTRITAEESVSGDNAIALLLTSRPATSTRRCPDRAPARPINRSARAPIAIVIAVIEFLWDGWRPHSAILGRVDNISGHHDITRYPQAHLIPGLVMLRWDAPLFFANAELFHDRILGAIESAAQPGIIDARHPVCREGWFG